MTDDDPLFSSPLGPSIRAAHRALRALAPADFIAVSDDDPLPVIVDDLEDLVRRARDTAAGEFGPRIWWVGPLTPDDLGKSVTLQIDMDGHAVDDPPAALRINDWEDSALARAGRAYKRDCGWDFSPDGTGIWLVSVAPHSFVGDDDRMSCSGMLTGFLILHDRNNDGAYESMAHMWTARAWRRRGLGTSLLRQARERFPLRQVEGPATEEGRLLLERSAPDLLDRMS